MMIFLKARHQFIFKDIFINPVYLKYLFQLPKKLPFVRIIDCGATIGLFSLLVEHLRRIGVFEWKEVEYILVEPLLSELKTLRRNAQNLKNHQVIWGAVGNKKGTTKFYPHPNPTGSNIFYGTKKWYNVPFIDLTKYLDKNTVLKLDIERAEWIFLEEYDLDIMALLVERHYFSTSGDNDGKLELIQPYKSKK